MVGWLGSVQPAYAQAQPNPISCFSTITTSVTLTSDLICTTTAFYAYYAIQIGANHITLNCNRFKILNEGSVGEGILIHKKSHVTVEYCDVEFFLYDGIDVVKGSYDRLIHNYLYENGRSGACLTNSDAGIGLSFGSSNIVTGNIAESNYCNGFSVWSYLTNAPSTSFTISGNTAQTNAAYGFFDVTSGSGTAGTANTYTSNTCIGNNGGGAQSSPVGLC